MKIPFLNSLVKEKTDTYFSTVDLLTVTLPDFNKDNWNNFGISRDGTAVLSADNNEYSVPFTYIIEDLSYNPSRALIHGQFAYLQDLDYQDDISNRITDTDRQILEHEIKDFINSKIEDFIFEKEDEVENDNELDLEFC